MKAEHQQLEWKESSRDEHLKWVCAFAHAEGGTLVVTPQVPPQVPPQVTPQATPQVTPEVTGQVERLLTRASTGRTIAEQSKKEDSP